VNFVTDPIVLAEVLRRKVFRSPVWLWPFYAIGRQATEETPVPPMPVLAYWIFGDDQDWISEDTAK
jgi:hypothetical protein